MRKSLVHTSSDDATFFWAVSVLVLVAGHDIAIPEIVSGKINFYVDLDVLLDSCDPQKKQPVLVFAYPAL